MRCLPLLCSPTITFEGIRGSSVMKMNPFYVCVCVLFFLRSTNCHLKSGKANECMNGKMPNWKTYYKIRDLYATTITTTAAAHWMSSKYNFIAFAIFSIFCSVFLQFSINFFSLSFFCIKSRPPLSCTLHDPHRQVFIQYYYILFHLQFVVFTWR